MPKLPTSDKSLCKQRFRESFLLEAMIISFPGAYTLKFYGFILAAGLSTSHVCADRLLYWNTAAKRACLLITYLVAALSNTPKLQAR